MRKIINTLLLLGLFVVMTGCHENDGSGVISTPRSDNFPYPSSSTTLNYLNHNITPHNYDFVWNINNPYDSTGFLHNEALDYYITHYNVIWDSEASLSTQITEFYNVVSPFYSLHQMDMGLNYYQEVLDTLFVLLPNQNITLSQHLLNQGYSVEVVDRIDELFDIAINSQDVEELCNQIKTMENEMVSSSFPDNEKQLFLKGSSVVKFSATYWTEVKMDPANGWHDNGVALSAVGPITRALVDAAGFFASWSWTGAVAATSAFVMTVDAINAAITLIWGPGAWQIDLK